MNRTQRKAVKKQQAAQMAAVLEMRAAVHRIAEALYVAGYPNRDPNACIRAGIAFVDALNAFVPAPAPSPMPPPELREVVAAEDARLDAEGEGRELARDAAAELLEPGSEAEMEANQ